MLAPLTITSLHNPRFKRAVKLRDRRQREKHRRFLIEGLREISLGRRAGIAIEELFICPSLYASDDAAQIAEDCAAGGTQIFSVARALMDKLCFGDRAEGLLAVAVTPSRRLDDLRLPERPLVAVLEGIEKPGNVGAIFRTADGAGLDAVIVSDPATDLFNPNAIRASLGTIFTVPAAVATSDDAAGFLRGQGLHILAARVDAAISHTQPNLAEGAAIVLGSEATGLSGVWTGADVTPIGLPMLGAADSLNVSAAAAVVFYEARRQRNARGVPTSERGA